MYASDMTKPLTDGDNVEHGEAPPIFHEENTIAHARANEPWTDPDNVASGETVPIIYEAISIAYARSSGWFWVPC